jgi:hypothetical protein
MKFDTAGRVEDIVWQMRQADLPRGDDRSLIQKLFNGSPPFDPQTAEENNVEVNVNDLEGVNLLSQGREQWNSAMLPPGNFISINLDWGPVTKRSAWSEAITRNYNKELKLSRPYMQQQRACGGNSMLYGIGPANWKDRRDPIPKPIPVASLMIPSETEIDLENLEYYATFRELTPTQLFELTHGPKVDPGWNLPLVTAQLKYLATKLQKEPNATAYQYMPERIEELIKQDKGYWGSDAVPTCDIWDFRFREAGEGDGWYRRIILDWGLNAESMVNYKGRPAPKKEVDDGKFLYSSGKRKYANSVSEMLHCQFADCSCYFPQKYHSVRSLGWMLWGVCELQNRLHCKFNEQVFLQCMWFFRVASDAELRRLKSANFMHFGIIPPGVNFIPGSERFKPDMNIIELAFARNKQLMNESASAHNQDFQKGESGKEQTATEIMAKVNAVNARVGGMLNLAYTEEEFKDREICRRYCIPNNPYATAKRFRLNCLKEGVPPEALDVEKWVVTRERVLGNGNQTLQMAIAQGLETIRGNVGPDEQRFIDHQYVLALTKRADMAEKIAPIRKQERISDSMNDAQLATERLMRGLKFFVPEGIVPEDYVKVWLADLADMVEKDVEKGNMATAEEIAGFNNMVQEIQKMIAMMGQNKADQQRVRDHSKHLNDLQQHVKAFEQRLVQQMKAQAKTNGQGGVDPKDQAKAQVVQQLGQLKIQNARESHAVKTGQKQVLKKRLLARRISQQGQRV